MYMSGKAKTNKNLLEYSSFYQPKPIDNKLYYAHSYPEQRYGADDKIYDSRIKILDKFGTTKSL